MRPSKILIVRIASAAALGSALLLAAVPASAYTACNSEGDCWHTDSRVSFPGVTLSFHDDKWRDAHKDDAHMRWHDADNDHDWHHGYWTNGEWHPG